MKLCVIITIQIFFPSIYTYLGMNELCVCVCVDG